MNDCGDGFPRVGVGGHHHGDRHDLRHGAASLALAAGVELKVVQDMLGHASIVLTADTYTSVLPEVARQAAEDTAALIIKAGCLVPGTARAKARPDRVGRQGLEP